MTYDQLEVFEMIVEKGSFKAAAEALHKTQPTLSIAIKKLESEFDLLLLSREEYRPTLTEQGKVFYTWAKECLSSYRKLNTIGKELGLQKIEPELTIVVDPLARFPTMEGIFEECLSGNRPTVLTLRSEVLGQGMDLLLEGEAHFAVAPMPSLHKDIESVAFDEIELIPCIASKIARDHSPLDIAWLATQTQIIVRSSIRDDEGQGRDTPHIGVLAKGRKCYVTDHTMKRNLITEGFGWGRLARHEIEANTKTEAEPRGKLITLDGDELEPTTIALYLMRNKLKPMGPVAKSIWIRLQNSSRNSRRS